jgi:cytochrome c-type biogenesis protein CcmH/NrfF
MSVLIWLVPILAATVLAAAWTAWVTRTRKPLKMKDSMAAHQKRMAALARTARTRDSGRP